MELVWNYYREISAPGLPGGLVHYFDESSQSIYLSGGGLSTRLSDVPGGHWGEAAPGEELSITEDDFTKLRLDHPANGVLYGVATEGKDLVYLRYVYAMDLSNIAQSVNWTSQMDSAVSQLSASILNVSQAAFAEDVSLFQPGARLTLRVRMGNSQPYPIGVAFLDDCQYDARSETVPLSARNTIGYFLRDQTFDDDNEFTGLSHEIAAQIFAQAGITRYEIQLGTGDQPFTFAPEAPLLSGLEQMQSFYTDTEKAWQLVELPDGTVLLGYDYWIAERQANGYYTFEVGGDIFRRKTRKSADASYTAVRVTGEGPGGTALTPCRVAVTNFPYWSLGAHRTRHLTAPKGMTQEQMDAWAALKAQELQYVGVGEDFTGPFRPQLLPGDVAESREDGVGSSLGVITEVRQTFSRTEGFRTEFTVDSGGVATDGDGYIVYSRAAALDGYNRRQRIADLIRVTVGK